MTSDMTHCAGCGAPLPLDWIITPSLCERCEEQIAAADMAWQPKTEEEQRDEP